MLDMYAYPGQFNYIIDFAGNTGIMNMKDHKLIYMLCVNKYVL